MRAPSYASQLAAAEAGTSRDGRRSTVDRQRARGSRFFLQKNASALARWGLSDAGAPPPRRLALVLAVRRRTNDGGSNVDMRGHPLVQHLQRACRGGFSCTKASLTLIFDEDSGVYSSL